MIPKIIHYCWFGHGELPELAKSCILSWKKYCPDYEIKEWNEDNFNLDMFPYVREAYNNRGFAFVTDVVRLYALYNEGGIYIDTDVEILRSLDFLLQFDGVMGFETPERIQTALMASKKGLPIINIFLASYERNHFLREDGTLDMTTNVTRITKICSCYGFIPNGKQQIVEGLTILPKDYFSPKDYYTSEIHLTDNTFCIHHFAASWHTQEVMWQNKMLILLHGFPYKNYLVKLFSLLKYHGIGTTYKVISGWMKRKLQNRENIL